MEIPPPPPPSNVTEASGSEMEPPTLLEADRKGKQPAPPSTHCVIKSHQISIPYGKCTKNYAATTGGLILDGCGEFMPSLNSTPTDPTFLICDACGCHRSFHRETEFSYQPVHHVIEYQRPPSHHPPQNSPNSDALSLPPISSSYYYPTAPHIFVPLNPGGVPPPPQFTNNNKHHPSMIFTTCSGSKRNGIKRFRSKFSEDQKAKMREFAERIGWKLHKKDEEMILEFCESVGVTRGVFKVWMHNHKSTSVKNNHRDGGANGSSSFS